MTAALIDNIEISELTFPAPGGTRALREQLLRAARGAISLPVLVKEMALAACVLRAPVAPPPKLDRAPRGVTRGHRLDLLLHELLRSASH